MVPCVSHDSMFMMMVPGVHLDPIIILGGGDKRFRKSKKYRFIFYITNYRFLYIALAPGYLNLFLKECQSIKNSVSDQIVT